MLHTLGHHFLNICSTTRENMALSNKTVEQLEPRLNVFDVHCMLIV